MYTGKKDGASEVGLGGSVVTRLSRDLVGKSHHLFMDNFFTSVSLYRNLLNDGIYATGTALAQRRNFPQALVSVAKRGLPSRGDTASRQDGNLSVTVWQDTRPVVIMSTAHDLSCTRPVARRKADGSAINVECPIATIDYNKYMGGVDRGDQFRKYNIVMMKSRKCYNYIFWFLFEVCVLNTFF